ncbi:hypothetical protein GS416_11460 [Rhodococcus hoagii]|nr:hypothetical protein [Prescottella equi]
MSSSDSATSTGGTTASGPAVARALRARIPVTIPVTTVTDTADLLDVWAGARLAIVVDLVVPALLPRAGCAGGRSTTPPARWTLTASTSRPRSPSRGARYRTETGDRVRDVE